jgi:hypothetical protein
MLDHVTKTKTITALVADSGFGTEEWTKDYSPSSQDATALLATNISDQEDYKTDIAFKLTIKYGGKTVKDHHPPVYTAWQLY